MIETFKQPYIFSQMKNIRPNTLFFIHILNLISFKNNILQNSSSKKIHFNHSKYEIKLN